MAKCTLNYENWKITKVCVTETIATKSGKENGQKRTKRQEEIKNKYYFNWNPQHSISGSNRQRIYWKILYDWIIHSVKILVGCSLRSRASVIHARRQFHKQYEFNRHVGKLKMGQVHMVFSQMYLNHTIRKQTYEKLWFYIGPQRLILSLI